MGYQAPVVSNEEEAANTKLIIYLNIIYISFLLIYSFMAQYIGTYMVDSNWYIFISLALLLIPIPILITLGRAGFALMFLWIIFYILFGVVFRTLLYSEPEPMYLIGYDYHAFLILGSATWINLINHRLINQEPMSWDAEDKKIDESSLFLYKYKCKSVKMERVLIKLAYMYLFFMILMYIILTFFHWYLSYFVLVVVAVFALDMFWYATKYSKNMVVLAGIMGNFLLIMLVLSSFGLIVEFDLLMDIILTNLGFILLGASTLSFEKTNRLRRFLVFNWMIWSLYFAIGLIYSVYIFDTGVFIEFFLGFGEVSLIVGTTYQEAPI